MTIKDIHKEAEKLNACKKFTGNESLNEVIRLFLSAQGIEFCLKNNFPSLATFKQFKDLERFNIYVDAGKVKLKNSEKVVLIGNTKAVLKYDDPTKRHQVVLMHGAKADITADNFAVVFTQGKGVKKTEQNNGLIFDD